MLSGNYVIQLIFLTLMLFGTANATSCSLKKGSSLPSSEQTPYQEKNNVARLLTPHKKIIDQLIKDIQEKETDRTVIFRFLQGANFDYAAAKKSLQETMEWREANNYRAIYNDMKNKDPSMFPHADLFQRHLPESYNFGLDNNNNIVVINLVGRFAINEVHALNRTDFMEYSKHLHIYLAYHATELTHKTGVLVRATRVVDLSRFPTGQIGKFINLYQDVLQMGSDHFVEYMNSIVVVNLNSFVRAGFAVLSKLLNERTQGKIQVLTSPEDLKKSIPIARIPKVLGGSCDKAIGGSHCLPIGPGKKEEQEVFVSNADTTVIIELRASSDVRFQPSFTGADGTKSKMSDEQKVDKSSKFAEFKYHCKQPGTLVLAFNNPTGRFRSKESFIVIRINQQKRQ